MQSEESIQIDRALARCAAARTAALRVDVPVALPFAPETYRGVLGSRIRAPDNAASHPSLVAEPRALPGNARADQGPYDGARESARAGSRESGCDRVSVPLPDCIVDRLARGILCVYQRVRNVRREVVRAGNDAQPVPLRPRLVNEALGLYREKMSRAVRMPIGRPRCGAARRATPCARNRPRRGC